jgi:hypothetical protein
MGIVPILLSVEFVLHLQAAVRKTNDSFPFHYPAAEIFRR